MQRQHQQDCEGDDENQQIEDEEDHNGVDGEQQFLQSDIERAKEILAAAKAQDQIPEELLQMIGHENADEKTIAMLLQRL